MPMRLSNVLVIVCGLGIVFPSSYLAGQNPPSQGREVTKLHAGKCASCHGADMSGGSASSLADANWRYGSDDASITRSIRDGHPDAGMPAMGHVLNPAEIRALVIYIHERGAEFERSHRKYNAPSPGTIVQSEEESFKLESVRALITVGKIDPIVARARIMSAIPRETHNDMTKPIKIALVVALVVEVINIFGLGVPPLKGYTAGHPTHFEHVRDIEQKILHYPAIFVASESCIGWVMPFRVSRCCSRFSCSSSAAILKPPCS